MVIDVVPYGTEQLSMPDNIRIADPAYNDALIAY